MMRSIGGLMFIYGLASAVLNLFNYELVILSWMNRMDDPIPWVIRIGLVVVGAILWFAGRPKKQAA